MNIVCCLVREGSLGKVTIVELREMPMVGETLTISPTEVMNGILPDGPIDSHYIPPRNLIVVTLDQGKQLYMGKNLRTFLYRPASF